MKKWLEDFKAFAIKGNVIDLAIGVVVGGAFSQIVNALVKDIIMPIFGVVTGGINYNSWNIVLKHAVGKHPAITLNVGTFIQSVVNFLIISFSIFMCIKIAGQFYKKEETAKPIPQDIQLLTEIRDLLKNDSDQETKEKIEEKIDETK